MGNEDKKSQAIREAYSEAKSMKDDGVPGPMIEDAIKKKLISSGLTPEAAVVICSNLPGVREESADNSSRGKRDMFVGAGLFIFGVLITWVSEAFGIKKGAGYYVIALGPMITGIGAFIKGFFDYKSQL